MNPAEMFAVYALACRAVGRGGITAERIRDLASREDGLDPEAVAADAAALASASGGAGEALSAERTAAGILARGWSGRSATAATDLLERHCMSAGCVVAGLADAGEALDRLSGRLRRLLDSRTEAGLRIADRRAAEHPRWLGAAAAVLAGTADEAAVAVVGAELAPFVEADIGGDWVAEMTSIGSAVADAYREAAQVLAGRPAVRFEVPAGVVRSSAESPSAMPSSSKPPASPAAPPAAATGAPAAPFPSGFGGLSGTDVGGLSGTDVGGLSGTDVGGLSGTVPHPGPVDPGLAPEPKPESMTQPERDDEPIPGIHPEPVPVPDPLTGPAPSPVPDNPPEPQPPAGSAPETPLPTEPLPAEAGFGTADSDEPTPCESAAEALPRLGE